MALDFDFDSTLLVTAKHGHAQFARLLVMIPSLSSFPSVAKNREPP
jgi:hypothetical protein